MGKEFWRKRTGTSLSRGMRTLREWRGGACWYLGGRDSFSREVGWVYRRRGWPSVQLVFDNEGGTLLHNDNAAISFRWEDVERIERRHYCLSKGFQVPGG